MKLNENIQFNNEPSPQTVEKNIPDITKIKAANDGAKEISEADAKIFEDLKRREADFKKQRGQFLADMKQAGK